VQVIERDPARELTADAKTVLQGKAITDWVKQAKTTAQIQILIP
jgi:hypothetical protein